MTTPITAKVVEVPKPERPDVWLCIPPDTHNFQGYQFPHDWEAIQYIERKKDWIVIYIPGTRTLAAQAAERVRVLAGLKELADRDLDKRFLTAPERNMVTAAIAYIEGNKP